jgi:hypothetical protein
MQAMAGSFMVIDDFVHTAELTYSMDGSRLGLPQGLLPTAVQELELLLKEARHVANYLRKPCCFSLRP